MFVFYLRLPANAALVLAQVYEGDLRLNLPRAGARHCRIDFFCRSRREAQERLRQLKQLLGRRTPAAPAVRRLKPLPRLAWKTIWRRHFRARRIGSIVVRPPWQTMPGRKGDCIVEIEPGMAFGTGLHATTRSCLAMIGSFPKTAPPPSFLDIGCGSGILAVAAAKLGFRPVEAIDNDPLAVKAARNNFARNKVARLAACRIADIAGFSPGRKFTLVAANLFANLLVRSAGKLVGLLAPEPSSRLLLSGILAHQYSAVKRAFAARGLREEKMTSREGWVTALFKRK